jgi:hypothetical protein
MAAPTLTDYSYQYKDTGILLNADAAVMPFWDVTKISGLADFPELAYDVLDLDGMHGGFVTGNFFKHRMVIAEGNLYSAASDVDTNIENLKATLIPDGSNYPLYWKHPNKSQRYYMAKPVAFSSDVEAGRRTGTVPFQIQWGCTDPRSYIDIAPVSWTTGNNYTFTNAGNSQSGQIVTITANATTNAVITVSNQTQGRSFQIGTFSSLPVTSGQVIVIDVESLLITVAGVQKNAQLVLTGGLFPTVTPGLNTWRITSNVGNGTATPKSAWL